jgi:hypothetical protein
LFANHFQEQLLKLLQDGKSLLDFSLTVVSSLSHLPNCPTSKTLVAFTENSIENLWMN